MTLYQKKKSTKKPKVPKYPILTLMALLSIFLALPASAADIKKGDFALGVGYATGGTLADYKTVRDSGYVASVEYWVSDGASLLFEGQKLKAGNVYEASVAPKLGSVFIPLGVSYFDVDGADPEYGAHAGLGINFWAEKFLGLQVQTKYHYLLDQIAGEDQFLSASGTLRVRF